MEAVPPEAPLILFCRGERGLWAENTIKIMIAAAVEQSFFFYFIHLGKMPVKIFKQ